MSGRLAGRGVFITGGASGIGAACAYGFAAEGALVVIADLESAEDQAMATVDSVRATGGICHTVSCDVTSSETVAHAFSVAVDTVGDIAVVVTSAGVATRPGDSHHTTLLEMDPGHWQHVLDVNLTGTLNAARIGATHMQKRNLAGSIITLASFAAKRPTRGVYSVSKAAVWMLTRSLAEELGPDGIRVNSIGPGIIDTPMLGDAADMNLTEWKANQADRISLRRIGTPADVAGVALFLASDDSQYVTGCLLPADGGLASTFAGG